MSGLTEVGFGGEGVPNPSVSGTFKLRLRGAELGSRPRVRRVYDCDKSEGEEILDGGTRRERFALRYLCSFWIYDEPCIGSVSSWEEKPRRSMVEWLKKGMLLLREGNVTRSMVSRETRGLNCFAGTGP